MPPNTMELPNESIPEGVNIEKPSFVIPEKTKEDHLFLRMLYPVSLLLTETFMGIIVGASVLYAFRQGLESFLNSSTSVHIVLCVVGCQLLMAQGILSLAPENSWSAKLTLVQKRRAHWILQIVGSLAMLSGCFYKYIDKGQANWNTLHGIFALVAMIFVSISLANGLTSLYAYEFRRFLPGTLSKWTHICFGIIGFASSSISLIFAFRKNGFKAWASPQMANVLIILTVLLTFVVILIPVITLSKKSLNIIKKRSL